MLSRQGSSCSAISKWDPWNEKLCSKGKHWEKRQPTERGGFFSSCTLDRALVSRIYKEPQKLNNNNKKNQTTQPADGLRKWTDSSQKMKYNKHEQIKTALRSHLTPPGWQTQKISNSRCCWMWMLREPYALLVELWIGVATVRVGMEVSQNRYPVWLSHIIPGYLTRGIQVNVLQRYLHSSDYYSIAHSS